MKKLLFAASLIVMACNPGPPPQDLGAVIETKLVAVESHEAQETLFKISENTFTLHGTPVACQIIVRVTDGNRVQFSTLDRDGGSYLLPCSLLRVGDTISIARDHDSNHNVTYFWPPYNAVDFQLYGRILSKPVATKADSI